MQAAKREDCNAECSSLAGVCNLRQRRRGPPNSRCLPEAQGMLPREPQLPGSFPPSSKVGKVKGSPIAACGKLESKDMADSKTKVTVLRLKQLRLDQSSQRRWNWSGELSLGFPASPTSLALPKARSVVSCTYNCNEHNGSAIERLILQEAFSATTRSALFSPRVSSKCSLFGWAS